MLHTDKSFGLWISTTWLGIRFQSFWTCQ